MASLDLPRPHVFIAALGRSGSTMLANLLTTPPRRWVLIEPRFADGSTGRDVIEQARSVGVELTAEDWTLRPDESADARAIRVFRDRLGRLERWGLKEVRPDLLTPTVDKLDPRHVVVLVRDLRDVAISLYEKSVADGDPRYGEAWQRDYLTRSPAAILALLDEIQEREHTVARYEDLVTDTAERQRLGIRLDWPLDGRPDRHLADLFARQREVLLHNGKVTTLSLTRRRAGLPGDLARLVDWVQGSQSDFQRRFGYS